MKTTDAKLAELEALVGRRRVGYWSTIACEDLFDVLADLRDCRITLAITRGAADHHILAAEAMVDKVNDGWSRLFVDIANTLRCELGETGLETATRVMSELDAAEAERDAALRDAKLRSIHVREYGGRNERLRAERDRLREALETISRTKGPGDFVAFARAALSPRGENEET